MTVLYKPLFLLLLACCTIVLPATAQSAGAPFPSGAACAHASFAYRIVPAAGDTFGYEITKDEKPFIRQLTVPGQPGTAGFKDKAAAERVALRVIEKLQHGQMPPSVTKQELQELKAI